MTSSHEALRAAIDTAQEWCDAVDRGTAWDYWDHHFKAMKYKLLPAARAALEQPMLSGGDGMVMVPRDVIDFLCGAAPLDGKWFGEVEDEKSPKAPYWWRGYLNTRDLAYDKATRTIVSSAPASKSMKDRGMAIETTHKSRNR